MKTVKDIIKIHPGSFIEKVDKGTNIGICLKGGSFSFFTKMDIIGDFTPRRISILSGDIWRLHR